MATEQLLTDSQDIEWLSNVYLKNLKLPNWQSALVFGNEDCLDRIELFARHFPLVTDYPVAVIAFSFGVPVVAKEQ